MERCRRGVRVIDGGDQFTEVGWPLYRQGRRRHRARAGLASLRIPAG